MPCLLLRDSKLVKTVQFKNPDYIGDPVNAIKIYNEKEVDELIFLDITATVENKPPPFKIIKQIANECFMPLTYGGGVRTTEDMRAIYGLGVEKIAINSYFHEDIGLIQKAAAIFGNQSVVVSIDAKRKVLGGYEVFVKGGRSGTRTDPVTVAKKAEKAGAGEILLTSIDRDGTMQGYDTELIRSVAEEINVPLIACGGAGKVDDFTQAVKAGASAVAAGSMVVYQGRHRGVLINFPGQDELRKALP
jgi:cyclase